MLLNGFPGVGKLTIAKSLRDRLQKINVPHRLMDNHLLIDPVVAIEPTRDESHYSLRREFRQAAIEGLKRVKDEGLIVIFTACLAVSSVPVPYDDIDQLKQYVDLADGRGVPLIFVSLLFDLENNKDRLCSEEKKEGGKTKLSDAGVLEQISGSTSILDRELVLGCGKGGKIYHLELDTTERSVDQTTQSVLEYVRRCRKR